MEIFLLGVIVCVFWAYRWKASQYVFQKQMEKCESPIEEKLLIALFEEGYQPYTQIPCRGYRIDISLYYKGKKYAVECDGKAFHSTPKQLQHDEIKNKVLRKEKWIVIRFTGSEIYKDVADCVRQINRYTKKKS